MIHIAVLLKPYLDLILNGQKTIECRLTRQARPPFEKIEPGERLYLKQSAGPYRATAVADHVLCEGGLTPKRIRQIVRDYNEWICGPPEWFRERAQYCRFITLIWLRDVQPVDTGPRIRPLQGAAWMMLEDDPAWRCDRSHEQSFTISITAGNLKHGTLYTTGLMDRFPEACQGGRTRAEAGRMLTLLLHDGPRVETDIVAPRKLFRTRCWKSWFAKHDAREGDHVIFTPIGERAYQVGLIRGR
ncbi:MAG: ASCH domain-containing protein [Phycisphaerales bacterium]|nr:MAG: ASCH domain-containing protein [Phycisphaerales bacterium]